MICTLLSRLRGSRSEQAWPYSGFLATLGFPHPPQRRKTQSSFDLQSEPLLSPLLAALTNHPQVVENPRSLNPLFATLTSHAFAKSCVCHSCRKTRGVGVHPSFSQQRSAVPHDSGFAADLALGKNYTQPFQHLLHSLSKNRGAIPPRGASTNPFTPPTPLVPLRHRAQSARIRLVAFGSAARETSPLCPVSKLKRADIGFGGRRTPHPVASRFPSRDRTRKKAWVHRSL